MRKSWFFFLLFSSAFIWSPLRAERIVNVSPGTYNFSEIITHSGSSSDWVRYRPAQPGKVKFRGGELRNVQYVILDGFVIDGKLDPRYPNRSFGILIDGSNITIENSDISGPHDIHTGYDVSGAENCREATGGINWSIGITVQDNRQNVLIRDSVIHGFYYGLSFRPGTRVVMKNSIIRNNFNAVNLMGTHAEVDGNVFWVNPNHGLTADGAGVVYVTNNLIVDAQEMFWVWSEGVDELHFIHNTFYIPANKPCFGFEGIHSDGVRRQLVIQDNIFVNKSTPWVGSSMSMVPNLVSNHNLFFHYDASSTKQFWLFGHSPDRVPFSIWSTVTGEDGRSVLSRQPNFDNPPQYADFQANRWGFRIPTSVSEAWNWFTLRAGSPGKGAASDGKDMGIVSRSGGSGGSGGGGTTPTGPKSPKNLRVLKP